MSGSSSSLSMSSSGEAGFKRTRICGGVAGVLTQEGLSSEASPEASADLPRAAKRKRGEEAYEGNDHGSGANVDVRDTIDSASEAGVASLRAASIFKFALVDDVGEVVTAVLESAARSVGTVLETAAEKLGVPPVQGTLTCYTIPAVKAFTSPDKEQCAAALASPAGPISKDVVPGSDHFPADLWYLLVCRPFCLMSSAAPAAGAGAALEAEALARARAMLTVDVDPSRLGTDYEGTVECIGEGRPAATWPDAPAWARARILVGIPKHLQPPIPLTLLEPAFGLVLDVSESEEPPRGTLTPDELRSVKHGCEAFLDAACKPYANERARNEVVLPHLQTLLMCDAAKLESDAGSVYLLTRGDFRMFVTLEASELESICYYLHHYFPRGAAEKGGLPAGLPPDLRLAPTLLLSMCGGTMLSVQGVALTQCCVLSEVLASSTLLARPGSPQHTRLVNMLLALRIGVDSLAARYTTAQTSIAGNGHLVAPVLGSPLGTLLPPLKPDFSLGKHHERRAIVCGEPLRHRGLVFAAEAVSLQPPAGAAVVAPAPAAATASLVVKFCRGKYGEAAHRGAALAKPKAAPTLHGVIRLPGGWVAVVMENLRARDGWQPYKPHSRDGEAQKAAVLEAWRVGVRDLGNVHGDLRAPNILVRKRGVQADSAGSSEASSSELASTSSDSSSSNSATGPSWEARILDWDWAGKQGEACYPITRNELIAWPDGSTAGGPIAPEHDQALIEAATG